MIGGHSDNWVISGGTASFLLSESRLVICLCQASRILIPATLREYAKLNKKIILSGQGHNFELWDEDAWHKQMTSLDSLSKKEAVPPEITQLSL